MDFLKQQGEKLKKQVEEKTKEFADKHPDEIAKVRNQATKVLDTTQKTVNKGVEKLNESTHLELKKLPTTKTTSSKVSNSGSSTTIHETPEEEVASPAPASAPASAPAPETTISEEVTTPAPPEQEQEPELELEQPATPEPARSSTTEAPVPSSPSGVVTTSSSSSSLGKDYVSIELKKKTDEEEQTEQQEEEEAVAADETVEEQPSIEEAVIDDEPKKTEEVVEEESVQEVEEKQTKNETTTMSTSSIDVPILATEDDVVNEEDQKGEEQSEPAEVERKASTFDYPKPLSDAVASVNSAASPAVKEEEDDDDDDDKSGSGSGSDSDDEEDSKAETWPESKMRYAPIGDAESDVSKKGSSRLTREFVLGAGFDHLNRTGNKAMMEEDRGGKILPCNEEIDYYTQDALELMKVNNFTNKGLFVGKKARPATYVDKILLITDAPHAIRLYIDDEDGLCISGIALIRDDIIFTSGTLMEDVMEPLTLQLDVDCPTLESIEMQCCTYLEDEETGRLEKKISYIMLRGSSSGESDSGDTLTFGEVHEVGFDGKRSIYSDVESATGNLCLSGIGYFDSRPINLQIVDLGDDCEDVVDAMNTCVYYDNGVISGNLVRSRHKEVEFLNSITTENDDVWDVLVGCMDAVENTTPSYGELLPNAVNLFEDALGGDIEAIHSVFRMDRHLTHVIQNRKEIETFEKNEFNFYAKLIPMKQMWGIFANTIERIKRIDNTQPELNSFNVAFLQGTDEFMMQAIFIFLTQAALLVLTISHIWIHREEAFHIPSPLRFLVAICGTTVVNFMARQSKNNFEDFEVIFPEYVGTNMYKLDAFSNIVGGKLVTISTLILLMMTDDNLDIVLNATALLFVLELDECLVDTNPIWVTGVYRAYFMKNILKDLNVSDSRYWDVDYLRKGRGQHYRLHLPSCSILFPQAKTREHNKRSSSWSA